MGFQIEETSPYIYLATSFFALSALSSDLFFIRFSLTGGFCFLVVDALSGYSLDGSFSRTGWPFVNDNIDICMIINFTLFLLNAYITVRLIADEVPRGRNTFTQEEKALYRFFHSRCGMTTLEFKEVLKHGRFVDLDPNTDVPNCGTTLYLVLQGKVRCRSRFRGCGCDDVDRFDTFYKRSGEFFDIKLFNIFTIPVGFDNIFFEARTETRTRLFAWDVEGLMAMKNSHSPDLKPFWEFMTLRNLAGIAMRHHLRETDTICDSWLIPEDEGWLEGAPSRDFAKPHNHETNKDIAKRQFAILRESLWNIIPPKGVRHHAGIVEHDPTNAYKKLISKAINSKEFHFLSSNDNGNAIATASKTSKTLTSSTADVEAPTTIPEQAPSTTAE